MKSGGKSSIDVVFPALADLLDRWRIPTLTVASRGVLPHITLLYPWRPAPLQTADLLGVRTAVAGTRPFIVAFRQLDRFPGVLFLRPDPDDALRALTRRLVVTFPDTPPYGGQFPDPAPHLTVAKASTEDRLDRLEEEVVACLGPLFPLVFTVREIAIQEEGDDGMWSVHSNIALTDTD